MLRLLDPTTDLELYRTAFSWRPRPKRHVQPDRMSFDDFLNASLVVGLWDPEFRAVFVFCEDEFGVFDCHFTADVVVPRETLLAAARQITTLMLDNGAIRLTADIVDRNRPMRRFVEALGFIAIDTRPITTRQNDTGSDTLIPQTRNFVKYALSG